jgi:hypothetical protein
MSTYLFRNGICNKAEWIRFGCFPLKYHHPNHGDNRIINNISRMVPNLRVREIYPAVGDKPMTFA